MTTIEMFNQSTINNIPVLAQIMDWRRPGDKPLSEPMMVKLLTHIYILNPELKNCTQQCRGLQVLNV